MKKNCEVCGEEFECQTDKGKYCKNACNAKAYRERKRGDPAFEKRVQKENKRNYEKHKESRKAWQTNYRRKNPDKIFEQQARYRNEHSDELAEIKKKHRDEFREKWYSDLFCDHCESEENLSFHHLDPNTKIYGISEMEYKNTLEILAEMAKCIVLCNNCHMKVHANIRWGNLLFA